MDSGFSPEVLCFVFIIGLILQNIVMIKSKLFPIKFLLVYQDSIVSTPWLLKIICWDCVYPWAAAYVYCEEGSICPALTPRLAKSRDKPHTHIVAVNMSRSRPLAQRCVIMRAPKTALLAVSKFGVVSKISWVGRHVSKTWGSWGIHTRISD